MASANLGAITCTSSVTPTSLLSTGVHTAHVSTPGMGGTLPAIGVLNPGPYVPYEIVPYDEFPSDEGASPKNMDNDWELIDELGESVDPGIGKGGTRNYVIDHSVIEELCPGTCNHVLGGCDIQLNRCAFYRELYMSGEVDPMADFLFHGVCHGFDIVDPEFSAGYFCANYSSILSKDFRKQMDKIVCDELSAKKVSRVDKAPLCVHALGGVKKSNGKLRPITDCSRPSGVSINSYMNSTYAPFRHTTLDEICNQLVGGEFLTVVDIKAAYRSINVSVAHRTCQGFIC